MEVKRIRSSWPCPPPFSRQSLAKLGLGLPRGLSGQRMADGRLLPSLSAATLLLLLGVWLAAPLQAQTCTVPGTHATIQAAVDDPVCTTIMLSAQIYPESVNIPRSLTLAGPGAGGAVVQGLLRVVGAGTQVTLQDLRVENGCVRNALKAVAGAEVTGTNLEVEHSAGLPCPVSTVFQDGFELGDTSAWSRTVP